MGTGKRIHWLEPIQEQPRLRMLCIVNYRLPDSDYRIAFAARSADWAVDFASPEAPVGCKADSQWIPLDLSEGARLRELMTLVVLFKVLASKRHRYSVVHFFSSKVAVVGPLVACLARIPCIVTITGFGRIVVERRLRYRLLRRPYLAAVGIAMKLSRAVLFQNRADLNWSGARWPHLQSKFHYVGSATTSIPQRETPPSPPIRVVHVARLLRSKGRSLRRAGAVPESHRVVPDEVLVFECGR